MIGIDFGDKEPIAEIKRIEQPIKKEKEINLTYIFKALFDDRKVFAKIPHETKDKWGFIVNRFLSKKFPEFAQTINIRGADMGMILNLWWLYLRDKDRSYYWNWIWINGSIEKTGIDKEIVDLILDRYSDLKPEDIKYLEEWCENFDEEVEHLKKIKKQNG